MCDPMVHIFDPQDISQVYLSPHPYRSAFEESLVIGKSRLQGLPTAGMPLKNENGRLKLLDIKPSSPSARIPLWRSRIRGVWLISVNVQKVSTIEDVEKLIADAPHHHCPLMFAHSEVQHGHTNDVVPLINSD
jgi:hypothetical protein